MMPPAVPGPALDPGSAPRPRNRTATEAALIAAVAQVLAREGFGKLGVNAVAKAAGVDKVLIYRYFDGLPGLMKAYAESGAFWPTVEEIMGSDLPALLKRPAHERYAAFLCRFADALRARPLTIEILALETVERNQLTVVLETVREEWGGEVARTLGAAELGDARTVNTVSILLIAAIQYLMVRARKIRIFGGIDLQTDAGWEELKRGLVVIAVALFAQA